MLSTDRQADRLARTMYALGGRPPVPPAASLEFDGENSDLQGEFGHTDLSDAALGTVPSAEAGLMFGDGIGETLEALATVSLAGIDPALAPSMHAHGTPPVLSKARLELDDELFDASTEHTSTRAPRSGRHYESIELSDPPTAQYREHLTEAQHSPPPSSLSAVNQGTIQQVAVVIDGVPNNGGGVSPVAGAPRLPEAIHGNNWLPTGLRIFGKGVVEGSCQYLGRVLGSGIASNLPLPNSAEGAFFLALMTTTTLTGAQWLLSHRSDRSIFETKSTLIAAMRWGGNLAPIIVPLACAGLAAATGGSAAVAASTAARGQVASMLARAIRQLVQSMAMCQATEGIDLKRVDRDSEGNETRSDLHDDQKMVQNAIRDALYCFTSVICLSFPITLSDGDRNTFKSIVDYVEKHVGLDFVSPMFTSANEFFDGLNPEIAKVITKEWLNHSGVEVVAQRHIDFADPLASAIASGDEPQRLQRAAAIEARWNHFLDNAPWRMILGAGSSDLLGSLSNTLNTKHTQATHVESNHLAGARAMQLLGALMTAVLTGPRSRNYDYLRSAHKNSHHDPNAHTLATSAAVHARDGLRWAVHNIREFLSPGTVPQVQNIPMDVLVPGGDNNA